MTKNGEMCPQCSRYVRHGVNRSQQAAVLIVQLLQMMQRDCRRDQQREALGIKESRRREICTNNYSRELWTGEPRDNLNRAAY